MAAPALKHAPAKAPSPSSFSPSPLRSGDYLSDELSLFRCVSTGPAYDPDATALLEDCMTLELLVLPLEELGEGAIRLVRPGA